MNNKTQSVLLLSILCVSAPAFSACERSDVKPATSTAPTPTPTPTATEIERSGTTTPPVPSTTTASVSLPGIGSCEPTAEVSGLLARISETADSNGNGQIEKPEAYSAADFLVGGFFFRADKNFDGSLSPEEGRAARTELMDRNPTLAAFMQRAATAENSAALARMADLIGIEYDKAVSSTEMREAAHQVVDEVFRLADTDRSGSLTQGEALQAGWSRVRALASGAFLTYDGNGDKKLSLDEFQSALKESSRVAFQAADTDKDGALTANEVGSAVRGIARRVWLPAADAVKAADAQDSRNP